MRDEAADLAGCSLLVVFAHPDDESIACGGTIAWCARRGARVSVCCATGGEHGLAAGLRAPHEPADLRKVRLQELQAATHVLGVSDLVVLDFEDGMLPWVESARLEAAIQQTMERLQPDVVITFGNDGLYGHPDHVAVHEATTAAATSMGGKAPALYYVTMPEGSMTAIVRHVSASFGTPGLAPHLILGIDDPDAFGALALPPTLVVHVGQFATTKLAAIKCHQTQLDQDALAELTPRDAEQFLGVEHFHRAGVGSYGRAFIERLAAPAH